MIINTLVHLGFPAFAGGPDSLLQRTKAITVGARRVKMYREAVERLVLVEGQKSPFESLAQRVARVEAKEFPPLS